MKSARDTKCSRVERSVTELYNQNMGCSNHSLIEQHSFRDYSYENYFNYQFSYKNASDLREYFNVDDSGLRVTLYEDDSAFKEGSATFPRSELRHLYNLEEGVAYEVSFYMTLVSYIGGFDFSFFQAFGRSPNLMFRQRDGVYQLCALQSKVRILRTPYDVNQDIGQRRFWKFRFKFSRHGYFEVYRDGVEIGRIDGNTRSRRGYVKLGLYAQQMRPPGEVSAVFDNFTLSRSV